MNKKLINLFLGLLSIPAWAIDTQSKFRNTDRSLFETISDYQSIERGRAYFSNTGSLTSNPLVNSNGDVLINSLTDFEFSAVTGVSKNWEIGISIPYSQTTASKNSGLNNFSGSGDIYIENKFNILSSFSVVPILIYQSGDGLVGTGSNSGGFGLKAVGAFSERSKLPLYYSVGYYSLPKTQFQNIDQSQRIQASAGSMLNLTKEILLGAEFMIDHAKNRSSKELLAHSTMHLGGLSLRAGFGSGFLNQDELNNLRVFASLMFDLDFRSNKNQIQPVIKDVVAPVKKVEKVEEPKAIELNVEEKVKNAEEPLENKIESIGSPAVEPKQDEDEINKKIKEIEEIQKKLNGLNLNQVRINRKFASASSGQLDAKLLTENSLVQNSSTEEDDAMVIPGYTVRELKQINREQKKKEEISLEKIVVEKNERLKIAQKNLSFWVLEYETKPTQQNIQAELSWGLRVVDRRRNTLEELFLKNKEEMGKLPEGRYFQMIQESEKKAKEYLSSFKIKTNASEKISLANSQQSSNVQVVNLDGEKRKIAPSTLEQNQKKQWEISKKKTYRELMAEKKGIKLAKETQVIKAPNSQAEFENKQKEIATPPVDDLTISQDKKVDSDKLIEELTLATIDAPVAVENKTPKLDDVTDLKTDKNEVLKEQLEDDTIATVAEPERVIVESTSESSVVKAKENELRTNVEEPKASSGVVVKTNDTVSLDTVDLDMNPLPSEDAKQDSSAINSEVIIPEIESIVSSGVEIKQNSQVNENVDETLSKIKELVDEKKKEESSYSSLVDFYKKQVDEMKIKLEAKEAEKKPKKEVQLVIEEKAVPEFKPDGTIEIKHFKVNSIRERFQEEQPTAQEFKEESNSGIRNNDSGVMGLEEGGELEYSNGPSY